MEVLTSHQMCQVGEIFFWASKRLFGIEMVENIQKKNGHIWNKFLGKFSIRTQFEPAAVLGVCLPLISLELALKALDQSNAKSVTADNCRDQKGEISDSPGTRN